MQPAPVPPLTEDDDAPASDRLEELMESLAQVSADGLDDLVDPEQDALLRLLERC